MTKIDTTAVHGKMRLTNVTLRPILPEEEDAWNEIMEQHHPLGTAQFPGHRIKYIAEYQRKTVALACFSACAYHLADRDRWIGWSNEQATQRRHFVVQNSRFLLISDNPQKNLASRVLALCAKHVPTDWKRRFEYEPLLLETFVDPRQHRGVCYKAAGWLHIGTSKGFSRDSQEFYSHTDQKKQIWVKQLHEECREILRAQQLPESWQEHERPLPSKQVASRLGTPRLRSLFEVLLSFKDPRRTNGRQHPLASCLAMLVCGTLAGCKGMREVAEFAACLTQGHLRALRAWKNPKTNRYEAPKYVTFWRVTQHVDSEEFERAVMRWFAAEDLDPEAIAIDGKALRATLDNEDGGLYAVSAIGHEGTPFLSITRSILAKGMK